MGRLQLYYWQLLGTCPGRGNHGWLMHPRLEAGLTAGTTHMWTARLCSAGLLLGSEHSSSALGSWKPNRGSTKQGLSLPGTWAHCRALGDKQRWNGLSKHNWLFLAVRLFPLSTMKTLHSRSTSISLKYLQVLPTAQISCSESYLKRLPCFM